jgi:hypothetical protein
MLNAIQHLTKSGPYEILKQVQDDKTRLFTRPSYVTGVIYCSNRLRVGAISSGRSTT